MSDKKHISPFLSGMLDLNSGKSTTDQLKDMGYLDGGVVPALPLHHKVQLIGSEKHKVIMVTDDIKRRIAKIKEGMVRTDVDSWMFNMEAMVQLGAPVGHGLVHPNGRAYILMEFAVSGDSLYEKLPDLLSSSYKEEMVNELTVKMRGKYPVIFNNIEKTGSSLTELAKTLSRVEEHLDLMRSIVTPEDAYPDVEYPVDFLIQFFMNALYYDDYEMASMNFEVVVDGKLLHPRHYRVARNCEVTFLNWEVAGKDITVNYSKGARWDVDLNSHHRDKNMLRDFIDGLPDPDAAASFGKMARRIEALRGGFPVQDIDSASLYGTKMYKTKLASTGMALCTDMEGYGRHYFPVKEKENPPTVRTNSRQKLVDNGKRQWPGAKQRKGHRNG